MSSDDVVVGATGRPLPDLGLPPVAAEIGGRAVTVEVVPTPGICGYRLTGLSTETHHVDLVEIFGGWKLCETQRQGPEGAEFGWSRAWIYDASGIGTALAAAVAVASAIAWRVEHPDGADEPTGWVKASHDGRRHGAKELPT